MSKRVFHHPPEAQSGRKYWRSLGQLEKTPEFNRWLEKEFPQGAAEFQGGEVSRRNFLQLMGASMALAGLSFASCRRQLNLVPFTKGVEWSIPGKALFYATSMPARRGAEPLVVATYDGRPTKIEGNPTHPATAGASSIWAQSAILDLYDPDRSRDFLNKGQKSDSLKFTKALDEILASGGDGSGIAFLVERNHSPTRERLRALAEKKFPKLSWCVYEPTGGISDEVSRVAFGDGILVTPQLDKADVIMAVDCDFLSNSGGNLDQIRQFSSRRKVSATDSKMNRLYVVENRYTVTGGMADHRLRVPASQAGAFLAALANAIGAATKNSELADLAKAWSANTPFADGDKKYVENWVSVSASDLLASKGKSVVLVGDRQPAAVQLLGHAINSALGNLGKTLIGRRTIEKPALTIEQLAAAIDAKSVKALFILGGNPVYNAPADLKWAEKQATVPHVVRLGYHEDETSKSEQGTPRVEWHVPMAHFLEAWSDGVANDGSYTSVQPMILPLFDGWSELDLLSIVAGGQKPAGAELVQETFGERTGGAGDFTAAWAKFLHDGFIADSAPAPEALSYKGSEAAAYAAKAGPVPAAAAGTFEVVFAADSKVDDGRFANNGWLQELPDPITKLTWDNAALISPATAESLGIAEYDLHMRVKRITIKAGEATLTVPALISPGAADNSITLPLGYGRTVVGRVGRGTANLGTGFNAYLLRTSQNPYFVTGATVTPADGMYEMGVTQEHASMEGRGADFTREATLTQYNIVAKEPEGTPTSAYFQKMGMDAHNPKNVSLYSHPPLNSPTSIDPHAWGMTVDLNSCTGCSACMIACQAENNIPIVGKEQVIDNREMHWIRVDRYYASENNDLKDPELISQPLMCQHCENAPCETVCPVNATVHSEDGLNVMAYNRCIGTRYCANNCPFKVRRFNFFDYNQRDVLGHKKGHPFTGLYKWNLTSDKGMPDTLKMQKNPNVTVRMRGVMEKCTFCVQRIQEAKITAKAHSRDTDAIPRVPANAFTTACAQVCPTDAITFGDINNPESNVSKIKADARGYRLLEYLNVSTRVWYLARIRNPNPQMPDAGKLGAFIHPAGETNEAATPTGGHS